MRVGVTDDSAPPGGPTDTGEHGVSRRSLRRLDPELERQFAVAFDEQGYGLRLEIWLLALIGVGGVLIFHRYLLNVPPQVLLWGPLLLVGIAIPAVLRWLSGVRGPVRRWSQMMFVVAAYLDIACMMAVRIISLRHGIDVLPLIAVIPILMSLVVVQIRFALLVPTILLGLGGIAVAELCLTEVTSATLFELMAAAAIVCVSLASAYELENSSRAGWLRQRELDELSSLDSLTGLPNRRHLDQTLDRVLRSTAPGGSIVFAILDLDEFRAFNDRLGHPAGDECLATIGAHLRNRIRPQQESVARIAGEEFAVVWHGVTPQTARERAEILRRSIGELRIARPDTPTMLTASAGTAEIRLPAGARTLCAAGRSGYIHTAIDRADQALYQAKESGRNRTAHNPATVTAADPHIPIPATRASADDALSAPELHATRFTLRFTQPQDEAAFHARYEVQGRRTRRFIMIGLLIVCAVIFFFQGVLLKMPPEASTFGRLTLALGLAPAALAALLGATWSRLRDRSAPIYVGAVAVILAAQMFERAIQTPKGFDVVPYLMPVSVLLSLCVVQIGYNLLMPAVVALTAGIVACELVSLPVTGNEVLTVCATILMVVVTLRFAYLLERSRRLDWSRSRFLEVLSGIDPLTRLPNRRAFVSELNDRCAVETAPALLLLDVDHFKQFNDRFGHLAGDECLATVGDRLQRTAAQCGGFAARLGGEEFAIILPAGDRGQECAETLRAAVSARHVEDDSARPTVTASAGLAVWPVDTPITDPGAAGSLLLARADRALYEAKRNGRNRLEVDRDGQRSSDR